MIQTEPSYSYPTLFYRLYPYPTPTAIPVYDSALLKLTRCDSSSPLHAREPGELFFKGTAVAVLDASLSEVLGWTWFISSPGVRVQGTPTLCPFSVLKHKHKNLIDHRRSDRDGRQRHRTQRLAPRTADEVPLESAERGGRRVQTTVGKDGL